MKRRMNCGSTSNDFVWLLCIVLLTSSESGSLSDVDRSMVAPPAKEYCRWESFNVTCPPDGVIVVKSAFYGRMRFTRCTELDMHLACSSDVLLHLDDLCSGRRQCVVSVPNQVLHEIQPCPKDMQTYLEVDYECVKVQTGYNCQPYYHIDADGQGGHLSSLITEETMQGTALCPWLVRVQRGQRINVTMMDFSVLRNNAGNVSVCDMYAVIKEEGRPDETICGRNERLRRIYTSTSNELQIILVRQAVEKLRRRFLIRYESIGCADMTASRNSWVERNGETMTVGCNHSRQTWHLVCKGNQWVGDISNCSWGGIGEALTDTDFIYPYGLLFSVAIGILLGICVGGCLLALVLSCRRRHLHVQSGGEGARDPSTVYVGGGGGGKQPLYFDTCRLRDNSTTCGGAGSMLPNCRTDSASMTTSSYAHMWDLRRHQRQQLMNMQSEEGSTSKHLLHMSQENASAGAATTALAMSRLNRAPVEAADDPFYCSSERTAEVVGGRHANVDFGPPSSSDIALRHYYDSPDVALSDMDIRLLTYPYADGGPVYNEVSSVTE